MRWKQMLVATAAAFLIGSGVAAANTPMTVVTLGADQQVMQAVDGPSGRSTPTSR